MKKGCSSNYFPKTFSFKFHPDRVYPVGMKFRLKVFGRGLGGDSPQCGEMSAKLTEGTGDRWENLSSERFPPINTYITSV